MEYARAALSSRMRPKQRPVFILDWWLTSVYPSYVPDSQSSIIVHGGTCTEAEYRLPIPGLGSPACSWVGDFNPPNVNVMPPVAG